MQARCSSCAAIPRLGRNFKGATSENTQARREHVCTCNNISFICREVTAERGNHGWVSILPGPGLLPPGVVQLLPYLLLLNFSFLPIEGVILTTKVPVYLRLRVTLPSFCDFLVT